MIFDKKIFKILSTIRSNTKTIGYGKLLKNVCSNIKAVKVKDYLWEKDLIFIRKVGKKQVVSLTSKGERVYTILSELYELTI